MKESCGPNIKFNSFTLKASSSAVLSYMHTGGWWVNIVPANFKTLVDKNAIKPKIGGPPPPPAIFPESLDPPRDFRKKHKALPPLGVCCYHKNIKLTNKYRANPSVTPVAIEAAISAPLL